jgi:hypothetical protein
VSVSYQISDKRGDAILVVRVEEDTVEQAEAAFAAATGLAGLGAAYESFGTPNPVAAVPAAAIVTRPAEAWGNPPVQPMVPAAAAPAQNYGTPPAGQQQPPVCQHGAKLYKTGTGKNPPYREWSAWFCPAPGTDPTQCPKEWIR